ncbi:GMC family oxidoreductase [Nocardioides hwasunensis]|uniref:FAD-dependent oxidoreductase n=1 Tax=Nocardioides hwasunensis TaxID=397258 RepID=A0ABR8MLA6_9ACTN|nr:GMC family oxidoreductase [Nocardioides hwasunensis]MBD3915562.1 FAD-dependent oxidoreductase [Nocardioides hwasunensis]
MPKILVVGAGSAGCVVAARLSEHDANDVWLLESGPDLDADPAARGLASVNWIDALGVTGAFDARLLATRTGRDEQRSYRRGRLVGGSASVNAMLALPGLPSDYDRWADELGLDDWAWERVAPTFEQLRPQLVATEDRTPVDAALMQAAAELGFSSDVDTYTPADGGGTLYRNADETGRRSSREVYLEPALDRPNLTLRADTGVDRLLVEDDVVTGVVLTDGSSLHADQVVLCAGAIETPAILLRSGLTHPGIGTGLQDHPAASILLRLKPEARTVDMSAPCINAVLRVSSTHAPGDIHVLPMHGALAATTPEHHAVLMAAVMTVTSTGVVRLDPDDPSGPPVVEERMLATDRDRDVMRQAVATVRDLLATTAFQDLVEEAFIDGTGTPVSALDDEQVYQTWLDQALGDYFHVVGTARMGRADDPAAVVDQAGRVHGLRGVRVIDCSIIPFVPAANTHLPVVMVAERLSATLATDLTTTPTHVSRPEGASA